MNPYETLVKKNRTFRWDYSNMTEGQVVGIIESLGIRIASTNESHFSVYCPFHRNSVTPAATVSRDSGYFTCFNSACSERMPVSELIMRIKRCDSSGASATIEKYRETELPELKDVSAEPDELPEFDSELLASLQDEFRNSKRAQDYFEYRGMSEYSANYFGMGYDPGRDMICTPMFSIEKKPIGLIGRSIEGKAFKNSHDLPSSKTLFNIHNAIRSGSDTLIITESNFDAIRVNQAGYKNVVATLGGTFSDYHLTQVYTYFNRVILMTDDDDPGIRFAAKIARKCNSRGIYPYRAKYDELHLFPNGATDVSDQDKNGKLLVSMTDIAQCIQNASILL